MTFRARTPSLRRRFAVPALTVLLGAASVINGPVAEATASNITVSLSSSSVAAGSTVTSAAKMPVSTTGVIAQSLSQAFDPSLVQLTGANDITAPEGWDILYSTDGTNFTSTAPTTAAGWAAVRAVKTAGSLVSQGEYQGRQVANSTSTMGLPASGPFSNVGATGDGGGLFFSRDGYVFNIYHHMTGGAGIMCHTRTGGLCGSAWPYTQAIGNIGVTSDMVTMGWVDEVHHHIWRAGNRTYENGFDCVDISDIAAPRPCAADAASSFIPTGPAKSPISGTANFGSFNGYGFITDFEQYKGRIYSMTSYSGFEQLLCVDTQARGGLGEVCPGYPKTLQNPVLTANNYGNAGMAVLHGKLFLGYSPGTATCWDMDLDSVCAGRWPITYPTTANYQRFVYELPSADGGYQGVCFTDVMAIRGCYDDTGRPIASIPTGFRTWWESISGNLVQYSEQPFRIGSRLYAGNGTGAAAGPYVTCFDMSLNNGLGAVCPYFPWTISNYTVHPDPLNINCIWTNNHTNMIYTYDVRTGQQGCLTPPSEVTIPAATSVPRMACAPTSSGVTEWRSLQLLQPTTTEWTTATLTVKDSSGIAIPGWTDLPISRSTTTVDLSALPVATTGQTPDFVVKFTGLTSTGNVSVKVEIVGDSPELCLNLKSVAPCPTITAAGLLPDSVPASPSTVITASGTATAAGGSVTTLPTTTQTLSLVAGPSVACGSKLLGTAVTSDASQTPVPGSVVTLLSSTGTVLTYPVGHPNAGQPITATTDSNGKYSFPPLAPGSYKVKFVNVGNSTVSQSRLIYDSNGAAIWSSFTSASGTPRSALSPATSLVVGTTGVVNGYYSNTASAIADTTSGYPTQTQSISVTSNDLAATGQTMTASTVYLCPPGTTTFTALTCTLRPTAASPLVVPGEGSYWVDATTGVVSFLPVNGFSGTATGLSYIAKDSLNNLVNSTYTPTVLPTPAAPTANPDSTVGLKGATQTATLYANDVEAALTTLNPASTKLCDPNTSPAQAAPNCTATSVTVSGVGSYSLNSTTGVVTFTPLANYTGTAPALNYQVSDSLGRTATSTYTPTVVGTPSASPDTSTGAFNTAQVITPSTNDSASTGTVIAPSSIRLCSTGQVSPNCTATTVTVTGVGTYVVNAATGDVTFTPTATFTGTAPALNYQIADGFGQKTTSTITVTVTPPPTSTPVADTSSGLQGVVQTKDLDANDTAAAGVTLTTSTMRLCSGTQVPPSCTATTVSAAGVGTYTLNTTTGVVTFTPCSAVNVPAGISCTGPFLGTAAGVTYQITDSLSRVVSTTYTPTVVGPPSAVADTSSGAYNTAQTITPLSNDSANGSSFTPSTVKLCLTSSTNAACAGSTLLISGQGTYAVNADGSVSFTPVPGFSGTATPIKYVVSTIDGGQTNSTITPTVAPPAAPTATPASATVKPLSSVTFPTITGASGLATGTGLRTSGTGVTCLSASAGLSPCSASVTTADGTWSLDAVTGVVTYTNTDGTPSSTAAKAPVYYRVTDAVGQTASSTLTPVVPVAPTAANDTSSGAFGVNQVISILGNDSAAAQTALDPSTVRLCGTGQTPNGCTQTSVAVANEGTYTVNANGSVTFEPLPGFTGTAAHPPTYQVSDLLGQTASATITPTVVGPVGPTATAQGIVVAAGGTGTFRTITGAGGLATAGTGALVPASTCLILPQPGPATCAVGNTISFLGEGTYTLDPTTGIVTYVADPAATSGAKTAISYRVTDANGLTATSTLTPTVPAAPAASADASYGETGKVQTIAPAGNDSAASVSAPIVPGSIRLCDPNTSPAQSTPNCTATSVTTVDGTYSLDTSTGVISFTPSASFDASAASSMATATAPVTYVISDSLGQKASAVITPHVLPKPAPSATNDTGSAAYGQSVTLTPLANDSAGTTPADTTTTVSAGVTEVRSVTGIAFGALKLCGSGETPPSCTQTTVTTIDGTYVLSGSTVVFTPVSGFTGTVTMPVQYQVSNSFTRNTATTTVATVNTDPTSTCTVVNHCTFTGGSGTWVTTTVVTASTAGTPETASAYLIPTIGPPAAPAATNDSRTTIVNTVTTVTPLANDSAGQAYSLNSNSLRLCDPNTTPAQSAPNCSASNVTIAGRGTFALDPTTHVVTFTPAPDYVGAVPALGYQVADTNGTVVTATITITVSGPTATADTSTGLAGATQTLTPATNDTASTGATMTASSVRLCTAGQLAPSCTGTSLKTADGIYTVNTSTGVVSFVPDSTFITGNATEPVTYVISDSAGAKTSSTLTPSILAPPAPVAVDDTGTALAGGNVVFSPISGTASSAQADSAGTAPPARGGVSFSTPSLVTTSVRLCVGTQTAPDCTATSVTTSEGTYTVTTGTGVVTFVPAAGFTGTAQYPVRYQVDSTFTSTDQSGTISSTGSASALLTPTIVPVPEPTASNDSATGPYETPLVFSPWSNDTAVGSGATGTVTRTDSGFAQAALRLCDTGQVAPGCTATTVTVAEGVYTVGTDGRVTFTPNSGFHGTATSVTYQLGDAFTMAESVSATSTNQLKYATAVITPTILPFNPPSAVPDSVTSTIDTPVDIPAYSNDVAGTYPISDSTVRLCDVTDVAPACNATTVTLPQGTFTVDINDGDVTFTPASGWTGAVSIDYVIADSNGNMTHSVITVVIPSASSGVNTPGTTPAVTPPTLPASEPPAPPTTPTSPVLPVRPTRPTPALAPQRDQIVVNPSKPARLDPLNQSTPTPGETFKQSSVKIWDGDSWVTSFTDPAKGTWTVVAGQVEFSPAKDYVGTAEVRVKATDTAGVTAKSTLRVIIKPRGGALKLPIAKPAAHRGDVPASIHAGVAGINRRCPSTSVGGKTIAWIEVGGVRVPIKSFTYPAGGEMNPPASNRVAGLSRRHAALDATTGTSVITWHVRYGEGCDGTLNALLDRTVGSTFTVSDESGKETEYAIAAKGEVPKGAYKPAWFDQTGGHRLTLFTCGGLRGGKFTTTQYIQAVPKTH